MLVNGEWHWNASDKGSTATIAMCCWVKWFIVNVAAVGDSSAMLYAVS